MLIVYFVGGILVWVVIAFGLAALFRGTDDRQDAHGVVWLTTFWPITIPLAIVLGLPFLVIAGAVWLMCKSGDVLGDVGTRYIDFVAGEHTLQAKREARAKFYGEKRGDSLCGSGLSRYSQSYTSRLRC